jgi:hypothetical protein
LKISSIGSSLTAPSFQNLPILDGV